MRLPTSPSRPGERSDRDADSLRHLGRSVQRFMAACARMPVVADVGSREWRFSSVLQIVRARFPQTNAATLAEKMQAVLLVEWMSTVVMEEVGTQKRAMLLQVGNECVFHHNASGTAKEIPGWHSRTISPRCVHFLFRARAGRL